MNRITALILLLLATVSAQATFNINVTTSGPVSASSIITSDPSGISCPPTCSAPFTEESTVTLTQVSPSTIAFVAWSGVVGCRTNFSNCNFTLDDNTNVLASFSPILDLSFSGIGIGIITSTGVVAVSTSIEAGVKISFIYPEGTTVVLNQSTGTQSAFVGWSGDGGCSTASTCTITLDNYISIVATFTASAPEYSMTVSIPRGGGNVTSSPSGISCPGVCTSNFTANVDVTFTTVAAAGFRFAGWANAGCNRKTTCVVKSTSPLQGLGGRFSPAAYFFPVKP